MDKEESDNCPICLLELGDNNRMITKCGHTFCGSCFVSSLNFTLKCPMCRQDMVDINSVQTPSRNVSPPILYDELPSYDDLRDIHGEIITQRILSPEWNSNNDHADIKRQIMNMLHVFELDIRMVVSPIAIRHNSISDISYDFENSSENELDAIMANMELPEN